MFLRIGYYNVFKINTAQFVDVLYKPDTWYRLDVFLDWTQSKVALFIDGKLEKVTRFYSYSRDEHLSAECKLASTVDRLALYTLTPNVTSSFRSLRVCQELCPPLAAQPESALPQTQFYV